MKITIYHAASSYGQPVILDDRGGLMNYPAGIKLVREKLKISTKELGIACGVSQRTVEGWEQGRRPSAAALNAMANLLEVGSVLKLKP